jgi:hypothetical protein
VVLLFSLILVGCPNGERESAVPQGPDAYPPVELSTGVDRAEARVAEPITFRITLETAPDISASLPEVGSRIQGFRIVDMGREGPKAKEGRVWSQRWYELQGDFAGSYVLPGVRLPYADSEGKQHVAETEQLFVEIKSLLDQQEEAQDIRDLKPLEKAKREIPRSWLFLSLGGLGILGLVAGLLLHLRRKRHMKQLIRSPEELAYEELQYLEATGLLEEERYREYVFGLSLIFRRYLERRFQVPAAEQTTEEIFVSLRETEQLDKTMKEMARSFLEETDPIKYRGLEPQPVETERWRDRLVSFMDSAAETKVIQEAA